MITESAHSPRRKNLVIFPMFKIDKKRIIKFLVIMGIFIIVDGNFNVMMMFNKSIQSMILLLFGIKTDNVHFHSSLPISIAVIWSAKRIRMTKKIEYSISLIIIYSWILTITTAIGIKYPYYSPYILVVLLTTMVLPIILWKLS